MLLNPLVLEFILEFNLKSSLKKLHLLSTMLLDAYICDQQCAEHKNIKFIRKRNRPPSLLLVILLLTFQCFNKNWLGITYVEHDFLPSGLIIWIPQVDFLIIQLVRIIGITIHPESKLPQLITMGERK